MKKYHDIVGPNGTILQVWAHADGRVEIELLPMNGPLNRVVMTSTQIDALVLALVSATGRKTEPA